GGQQAEQDRGAGDKKAARDVRRHIADKQQRRLRRPRGKDCARRPGRRSSGEVQRQSSRKPESAGRRGEDGEEEDGAGGEDRPEDALIADRRKPQPVDQGAARAPEDDQAKDDDRAQDRKVFPTHGAASFRGAAFVAAYCRRVSSPGAVAKPSG